MKPLAYTANLAMEPDGGFTVTFPDIPEAITCGNDEEDALNMARDCLEAVIAFKIKENEDMPLPRRHKGGHLVYVPTGTASKLFIYWEMKRQGVRKSALARRLNWHAPQVDRLLDVKNESKLSQMETAFAALGKTFAIGVADGR